MRAIPSLIWQILFWPVRARDAFSVQEHVWFRPLMERCKRAATGVGRSRNRKGSLCLVIGVAGAIRQANYRFIRRHPGRRTGDVEGKSRKLCMGPDLGFRQSDAVLAFPLLAGIRCAPGAFDRQPTFRTHTKNVTRTGGLETWQWRRVRVE